MYYMLYYIMLYDRHLKSTLNIVVKEFPPSMCLDIFFSVFSFVFPVFLNTTSQNIRIQHFLSYLTLSHLLV